MPAGQRFRHRSLMGFERRSYHARWPLDEAPLPCRRLDDAGDAIFDSFMLRLYVYRLLSHTRRPSFVDITRPRISRGWPHCLRLDLSRRRLYPSRRLITPMPPPRLPPKVPGEHRHREGWGDIARCRRHQQPSMIFSYLLPCWRAQPLMLPPVDTPAS